MFSIETVRAEKYCSEKSISKINDYCEWIVPHSYKDFFEALKGLDAEPVIKGNLKRFFNDELKKTRKIDLVVLPEISPTEKENIVRACSSALNNTCHREKKVSKKKKKKSAKRCGSNIFSPYESTQKDLCSGIIESVEDNSIVGANNNVGHLEESLRVISQRATSQHSLSNMYTDKFFDESFFSSEKCSSCVKQLASYSNKKFSEEIKKDELDYLKRELRKQRLLSYFVDEVNNTKGMLSSNFSSCIKKARFGIRCSRKLNKNKEMFNEIAHVLGGRAELGSVPQTGDLNNPLTALANIVEAYEVKSKMQEVPSNFCKEGTMIPRAAVNGAYEKSHENEMKEVVDYTREFIDILLYKTVVTDSRSRLYTSYKEFEESKDFQKNEPFNFGAYLKDAMKDDNRHFGNINLDFDAFESIFNIKIPRGMKFDMMIKKMRGKIDKIWDDYDYGHNCSLVKKKIEKIMCHDISKGEALKQLPEIASYKKLKKDTLKALKVNPSDFLLAGSLCKDGELLNSPALKAYREVSAPSNEERFSSLSKMLGESLSGIKKDKVSDITSLEAEALSKTNIFDVYCRELPKGEIRLSDLKSRKGIVSYVDELLKKAKDYNVSHHADNKSREELLKDKLSEIGYRHVFDLAQELLTPEEYIQFLEDGIDTEFDGEPRLMHPKSGEMMIVASWQSWLIETNINKINISELPSKIINNPGFVNNMLRAKYSQGTLTKEDFSKLNFVDLEFVRALDLDLSNEEKDEMFVDNPSENGLKIDAFLLGKVPYRNPLTEEIRWVSEERWKKLRAENGNNSESLTTISASTHNKEWDSRQLMSKPAAITLPTFGEGVDSEEQKLRSEKALGIDDLNLKEVDNKESAEFAESESIPPVDIDNVESSKTVDTSDQVLLDSKPNIRIERSSLKKIQESGNTRNAMESKNVYRDVRRVQDDNLNNNFSYNASGEAVIKDIGKIETKELVNQVLPEYEERFIMPEIIKANEKEVEKVVENHSSKDQIMSFYNSVLSGIGDDSAHKFEFMDFFSEQKLDERTDLNALLSSWNIRSKSYLKSKENKIKESKKDAQETKRAESSSYSDFRAISQYSNDLVKKKDQSRNDSDFDNTAYNQVRSIASNVYDQSAQSKHSNLSPQSQQRIKRIEKRVLADFNQNQFKETSPFLKSIISDEGTDNGNIGTKLDRVEEIFRDDKKNLNLGELVALNEFLKKGQKNSTVESRTQARNLIGQVENRIIGISIEMSILYKSKMAYETMKEPVIYQEMLTLLDTNFI